MAEIARAPGCIGIDDCPRVAGKHHPGVEARAAASAAQPAIVLIQLRVLIRDVLDGQDRPRHVGSCQGERPDQGRGCQVHLFHFHSHYLLGFALG